MGWGLIPQGNGQFWGLSSPQKSIGGLCSGLRENGLTDRDAVWGITHVAEESVC